MSPTAARGSMSKASSRRTTSRSASVAPESGAPAAWCGAWVTSSGPPSSIRRALTSARAPPHRADPISDHDREPLRRAGDAGVEPPRPALRECGRFVEQHDIVPLRALRFVHREHVAVVEFLVALALLPGDRLDRAGEAFGSY